MVQKSPVWMDPVKVMQAQIFMAGLTVEASALMWVRMMGLAGFWAVPPSEKTRKVAEKQAALMKAGAEALQGRSADVISLATARQRLRGGMSPLALAARVRAVETMRIT